MENNYNIIRIQKYLLGQLSREEMHDLEREALNDPLLGDALEGYRLQEDVNYGRLSLLQQRLAKRIEGQRKEQSRFYFTSQRLGIATTAAVLFVVVLVLFWMRHTMFPAAGVDEQEKEVQIELSNERTWPTKLSISPIVSEEVNSSAAARPVIGWADFGEYFQKEFNWSVLFSATEIGDHYQISFEIGELSKPSNPIITMNGKEGQNVNERLKAEIVRILNAGPLWRGSAGSFELEFLP